MTTVNTEHMQALVTALRSGKYVQTHHQLRDVGPATTSYCALGVAMDVAEKHGVPVDGNDWRRAALPDEVANWYGTDRYIQLDSQFQLGSQWTSVMSLNDLDGRTFPEIADALEHEFLTPEVTP